MHSHVFGHLDCNKLLSDVQHGFRKKCSCESQLLMTIQDLANGLKDGEQIDARVEHLVQLKIKISYENYLADILGVGSGDENEGSRFSQKNFLA